MNPIDTDRLINPIDTDRLINWSIGLARHIALLSKDPSTKVGAVIFDQKRRIVSTGYNGFARGVHDAEYRLSTREIKYKMILHAEANALMFAKGGLDGSTMVVTHPCCAQCASLAIQAGVKHIMWPKPDTEFKLRWFDDLRLTQEILSEAGVTVTEIE